MAMSGRYVARHARALRCPFRRDRRSSTAMSGRYLARDTPGRELLNDCWDRIRPSTKGRMPPLGVASGRPLWTGAPFLACGLYVYT